MFNNMLVVFNNMYIYNALFKFDFKLFLILSFNNRKHRVKHRVNSKNVRKH